MHGWDAIGRGGEGNPVRYEGQSRKLRELGKGEFGPAYWNQKIEPNCQKHIESEDSGYLAYLRRPKPEVNRKGTNHAQGKQRIGHLHHDIEPMMRQHYLSKPEAGLAEDRIHPIDVQVVL